jgi:HAD superfamily hydrolase (TIGR01509 family)
MDGLLLDTEALYVEATQVVVGPYGHTVTPEGYSDWIGREVSYAEFQELYPTPLSEEEVWRRLKAEFHRLCDEKLSVRKGVAEFLDGTAAAYPKAVASSTARTTIESHLRQVGLLARFATCVSARDVPRGKPAPDVFLEAARQLGVVPEACVVFEDSPHGVCGARAAGMRAVAVPSEFTQHLEFAGADLRVARLDEVTGEWLRGEEPGVAR